MNQSGSYSREELYERGWTKKLINRFLNGNKNKTHWGKIIVEDIEQNNKDFIECIKIKILKQKEVERKDKERAYIKSGTQIKLDIPVDKDLVSLAIDYNNSRNKHKIKRDSGRGVLRIAISKLIRHKLSNYEEVLEFIRSLPEKTQLYHKVRDDIDAKIFEIMECIKETK